MTCASAPHTLGPNFSVKSSMVAILLALNTEATWTVRWSPLGYTDFSMNWFCPRVLKEGLAEPSSTHTRCESPKYPLPSSLYVVYLYRAAHKSRKRRHIAQMSYLLATFERACLKSWHRADCHHESGYESPKTGLFGV